MTGKPTLLLIGVSVACGGTGTDTAAGAAPHPIRAPHVTRSLPELGAESVYPAPVTAGSGEELELRVWFSEPVEATGELRLEGGGEIVAPAVEWGASGTELSVLVRPVFVGLRPLADGTDYILDLSAVRALDGAPLDPNRNLSAGQLVFETGYYDALLNHACSHTLFGPFTSVAAAREPQAAPDIGATHVQYSVLLPSNQSAFSGWVRAHFATAGRYRFYFDAATHVAIERDRAADLASIALSASAAACPGITQELTLDAASDEIIALRLGPEDDSTRHVIVEPVTP